MAGEIYDYPNRQSLGLDPPWTVDNTGAAVEPQAPQEAAALPEKLPGQHAGLDELAAQLGHEWSADDLTVAEKQAELEQAGA